MSKKKQAHVQLKGLALLLVILFAIMILLAMQLGGQNANRDNTNETLKNTETGNETETLALGTDTKEQDVQELLTKGYFKVTEKVEHSQAEQDGILYFTANLSKLQVTNKDNQEAAEAINATLAQLEEEAGQELDGLAEEGQYYLEQRVSMEGDSTFEPYAKENSYMLLRNDERVFSLIRYTYVYKGGTHGDKLAYCLNFDSKSGRLLTLADLLDGNGDVSEETFMSELSVMILQQSKEMDVAFLDDYELSIPDLIRREGTFALTAEGLQIVAEPYVLGPYSSGMIVFTIPTEGLEGFNQEYRYEK